MSDTEQLSLDDMPEVWVQVPRRRREPDGDRPRRMVKVTCATPGCSETFMSFHRGLRCDECRREQRAAARERRDERPARVYGCCGAVLYGPHRPGCPDEFGGL